MSPDADAEVQRASEIYKQALIHILSMAHSSVHMRLLTIDRTKLELVQRGTGDTRVAIEYLCVDDDAAGQGRASSVLRALTDVADMFGWTLVVEPAVFGPDVDLPRLCALYSRFGFVSNATLTGRRDFSASCMYRLPTGGR